MNMTQRSVWQSRKQRHDGSSSPGFELSAQAAKCLRGGMGAPAQSVTPSGPRHAIGYSHPQRSASVVTTPSSSRSPLAPKDCQPTIPAHFAVHQSAAAILRAQRRRDLLASIEEFWRASGPDRVWWRRDARHRLAEWRTLYAIPERAAFQQAVARGRA